MKLRWLSVATLALAMVASTAVVASPAQAAGPQCRSNSKVFARGGSTAASRSVTVRLCIQRAEDGVTMRAWGDVSMGAKSGSADIVYHMVVNVRMEHNDDDMSYASCDAAAWANFDDGGGHRFECRTPDRYSSVRGGWTADGNVSYDIVGDGLNDLNWSLTGSPAIS
ncbi:hypothetical protein O7635_07575 [Asanoa sp. WMMD1127]|uniref:hypothetical protein n=1 Tax=Asanoa sp. WMMD1127 TaxID=3016107 RepID=UPI00241800F6|nr:hypothetical protein [Asanoa sp. WMMD1127]MDG4821711.1 hypothetical protein [Asanoa sp. WMMD1127]